MSHPSSQRFHELADEIKELHDRKQSDYGSASDPFLNVRGSEELGIPAWVGAVLRNNDKQVRLNKAAKDTVEMGFPALTNEGVLDSLKDQAVYALIAYVLYEEWVEDMTPQPAELEAHMYEMEDHRKQVPDEWADFNPFTLTFVA